MAPIAVEQHNGIQQSPTKSLNGTDSKNETSVTPSDRYHAASTESAIHAEHEFAAHNYHPLPIVFARAAGTKVWDPEGHEYLDFLSAYSAVNQGHCHPELVKALCDQASRLTLSSRAFHNDVFPRFAEMVTKFFNFDMVLPMNTGAEAVETAVKIARKWGYKVKGIPKDKAIVFSVAENFHGRTFSAISMSTDPESRENYGPYLPSIGSVCPSTKKVIPFNDIEALRAGFEAHSDHLAGIIVEPIQGEAGIVVPEDDYLRQVRDLCDKHNVLLICDEIQTGIARTGRLLCHEWSGIKPDLVTLGKAISGGMYPVSCVLGRKDVMMVIEPGTHGSTYGGNPLGCAVAIRALEIVEEEGLVSRAEKLGQIFRQGLLDMHNPIIKIVRGKGLLNAMIIDESKTNGHTAWDLCMLLKAKGLLVGRALKIAHVGQKAQSTTPAQAEDKISSVHTTDVAAGPTSTMASNPPVQSQSGTSSTAGKSNTNGSSPQAKPTHQNIIRMAPPLVITEEEIHKALSIIKEALEELPNLKGEAEKKIIPEEEKGVVINLED